MIGGSKERILIVDANSLQAVAGLNITHLLKADFDRVIITGQVKKDIIDDSHRPRKEVVDLVINNRPSWFEVREVRVENQHIKEDLGERESIALAKKLQDEGHTVVFLTDDVKKKVGAADQAKAQGVEVIHSLTLIERGDELGILQNSFKEERSRLIKVGLTPSGENIEASDARWEQRQKLQERTQQPTPHEREKDYKLTEEQKQEKVTAQQESNKISPDILDKLKNDSNFREQVIQRIKDTQLSPQIWAKLQNDEVFREQVIQKLGVNSELSQQIQQLLQPQQDTTIKPQI